jgi:hypothetical protein
VAKILADQGLLADFDCGRAGLCSSERCRRPPRDKPAAMGVSFRPKTLSDQRGGEVRIRRGTIMCFAGRGGEVVTCAPGESVEIDYREREPSSAGSDESPPYLNNGRQKAPFKLTSRCMGRLLLVS